MHQDFVYVLDYMRQDATAQAMGESFGEELTFYKPSFFLLLCLEDVKAGEKLSIRKGSRSRKVKRIIRIIEIGDLSKRARATITRQFCEMIVKSNLAEFRQLLKHPYFPIHKLCFRNRSLSHAVFQRLSERLWQELQGTQSDNPFIIGTKGWIQAKPTGGAAAYDRTRGADE